MKKWFIWSLCIMLVLTVTACGQEPAEPNDPVAAEPAASTENDGPGIGGDGDDCVVHSRYYHVAIAHFPEDMKKAFLASLGEDYEDADVNVRDFVRFHGITREEFVESMNGLWTEDNLDEIAWNHGNGCPYTKNQFLDAIYGDDPELTAWVFAPESTWPMADKWDSLGEEGFIPEEWPPEGYGFGETRPSEESIEEPAE